jgi:hypothetical protein
MAEVGQGLFLGGTPIQLIQNNNFVFANSFFEPLAPNYQVRNDSFSGSVVLAIPGTNFNESPINMSNYYDDISAVIRGTGNNLLATPTGSSSEFALDTTTNFSADGYTTSILTKDAGSWSRITPSTFNVGTQQYVNEGWFYFKESWTQPPFWHSFTRQNEGVSDTFYSDIGTGGISSGTTVRMRTIIAGSQFFTSTFSVTLNQWVHVAWVRSSAGALYGYFNGTRRTMGTSTANVGTSGTIRILGGNSAANDGEEALHQDLRITVGTDRGYNTATITPPSSIIEKLP